MRSMFSCVRSWTAFPLILVAVKSSLTSVHSSNPPLRKSSQHFLAPSNPKIDDYENNEQSSLKNSKGSFFWGKSLASEAIDGSVVAMKGTWSKVVKGLGRAKHLRREIKTYFSSSLETCLLKVTRPDNDLVEETYMKSLLDKANRLGSLKASYDCDPHEVVCTKLFKKAMEEDWRTVAKALCVLHRLVRESPPDDAERFSALLEETWGDGNGALGVHIRTINGEQGPWLKVYADYLVKRGGRLKPAMQALQSWQNLTSMRQLQKALSMTNTLLSKALALHFATDASVGSGSAILRSCCALVFQDLVEVLEWVGATGRPPALMGMETETDDSMSGEMSGRKENPVEQGQQGIESKEGGSERVVNEGAMEIAAECRRYEDLGQVITGVYSLRYQATPVESGLTMPSWISEMADLTRDACRNPSNESCENTSETCSSRDSHLSGGDENNSSADKCSGDDTIEICRVGLCDLGGERDNNGEQMWRTRCLRQ